MARIPYAELTAENSDLAADIAAQRGSVSHLYRMLLHSQPIAAGWLTYLTAVRQKCALPGGLRELVIMRIAIVNGARFEAAQHRPIALAEGISIEKLDALENWQTATVFDERERAVLAYTDAMTREIRVPDTIFAAVRKALGTRELVELTATIGAYNMVSRFLEALEIHGDEHK